MAEPMSYQPIPFAQWAANMELPLDEDCPECAGDPAWSGLCPRCTRRHLRAYREQIKADSRRWEAALDRCERTGGGE